jgi:putative transposase
MHDDVDGRRLRLIEQIRCLPPSSLAEVEALLGRLRAVVPGDGPQPLDWPHAPLHRLSDHGTYIVTAGTYGKEHHFRGADRLDYLQAKLLSLAKEFGWQLEAWAVFSNHYHFVAHATEQAKDLGELVDELHRTTATEVNGRDRRAGRRVWYNYWDTELTFEKSYFARLKYVHHNPVKHGLVRVARDYLWCSAGWFERTARPAQVRAIYSFKIDAVKVHDDFDPV